jgi:hypothetical protein
MFSEHKSIFTGTPKIVAGRGADRFVLGAPARPPRKLGPGSHTGGSKKLFFYKYNFNSNTYMFMKYKYYIVYTNKQFLTNLIGIGNSNRKFK